MRLQKVTVVVCSFAIAGALSVTAGEMEDARTMVKLPSDIENKMLVNMRDHIGALDDIIQAVQAGEYEKAEDIAESRLREKVSHLGDQPEAIMRREQVTLGAGRAGRGFAAV